ncbi:MAG: type II secretion system F family protein, partial [Halodesulfurarchaeum sp.]|nr:type II secretion system F family protein [Halodesulfurarchaeum sp.]
MSAQTTHLGGRSERFADLFYPLYERIFGEESEFISDLERKLAEARMEETVELYVSRALGYGFLGGLFLWIVGLGLGWLLFAGGLIQADVSIGLPVSGPGMASFIEAVKLPGLILGTGLFFGAIGFVTGFGILVLLPYSRSSGRKREINMLLPDAVSFMYALSIGGLNQLEILEAMARAEDTYGEVALEFRTIVQETEYFDVDYRTAIRRRSMETPSDDLAQFFTDMLSIINSGGDMAGFLEDKKETHMRTAKQEQEMTLQTLELFGEMYMTLSLFPLLLIIVLVVMSMLGQSQQFLLFGTVYLLLPLVSAAFLVLVSTVKEDDPGNGYLDLEVVTESEGTNKTSGASLPEKTDTALFSRIKSRSRRHSVAHFFKHPQYYFREQPLLTLLLTVPVTLLIVGNGVSPL